MIVYNRHVNLISAYKYIIEVLLWLFGVQAWGAGASHNACLHTESFSFDDAIVLLTVFEMLLYSVF